MIVILIATNAVTLALVWIVYRNAIIWMRACRRASAELGEAMDLLEEATFLPPGLIVETAPDGGIQIYWFDAEPEPDVEPSGMTAEELIKTCGR